MPAVEPWQQGLIALNPNLACLFYDNMFQPCFTFNTCLGISQAMATLPPLWAKNILEVMLLPGNMQAAFHTFVNGFNYCSLVNMMVAPRMQPLSGVLWNMKEAALNQAGRPQP